MKKNIKLIAGLGNPGDKYKYTRHSIGFAAVDALAEKHNINFWKAQVGCMVTELNLGSETVYLAKPQSFMNTSGGPLSKLMRDLHIKPQEIVVVHDEVDLPEGEIRVKFGGGLNAHNGLRSIAQKLKTQDFGRLRCGIGRPPGKMSVADWALRQLKGNYLLDFQIEAATAAEMLEDIIKNGLDA